MRNLDGTTLISGNRKARIANAAITLEHMNDKLEPLLKKDGERSKIYPADLTSLFAYDCKRHLADPTASADAL